ncbi:MAG: isoaspartyl peptidase/L-asparaginase, partial [Candidatus Binatus sp.]|uniref:isoaspartyl peptidase/L-asparaginase family protein n=1 Tax=Candidatus Binatus sp. TaxID=2811406 RepID=UPI003C796108
MARARNRPAIVAHGGAGNAGPGKERPERRRAMMTAIRLGAKILRANGSALEAVVGTVAALEDHPLFNAGYGSLLNSEGNVEMDASVMFAEPVVSDSTRRGKRGARTHSSEADYTVSAGAVAAVSRVRNPIMLARAVMEHSPHILMAGPGAESFARKVGIRLVRPEEMVTERARERWRARKEQAGMLEAEAAARAAMGHGTVGAAAVDVDGGIAAATSTGGVPGKLFGRVGDSALIGAGTFAHAFGGASATGQGEAIILTALCREAVLALADASPQAVAREAILEMIDATGAEAGVILVDRRGRIGYAHNAASMQVARYDPAAGVQHLWLAPIASAR